MGSTFWETVNPPSHHCFLPRAVINFRQTGSFDVVSAPLDHSRLIRENNADGMMAVTASVGAANANCLVFFRWTESEFVHGGEPENGSINNAQMDF
ncbi:hypothetical protein AVEN_50138-1 [Araneus ventricosus]|uniref:Uncharacterized protein n=1 Tax=Araneus ventricosus TaxID=182803 RepID=A0A4Y2DAT7_ARAVE|nr:hypothetical protein AVEN_50138-1 [Araneus ventricosus]